MEKRGDLTTLKLEETPADMAFFELANHRLDHVKAHGSDRRNTGYRCMDRQWTE